MSEGRYRALLCVVQVAVADVGAPEARHTEVIDVLDGVQTSPLAEVLADPAVEVVMHAGRQDVALLRRVWRTDVHNLFDTQVAAGFAGLGAQTGYERLLADVLGISLAKSASFTRWDRRPLTAEQVGYAREDVLHLLALSDALQERLAGTGRLEWAKEECRPLEDATDERDPEEAWRRLPRVARLNPRARAVAREIAAWRERTASAEDQPVAKVLGDAPLVEIAKRRPGDRAALEQIRGVQPQTLRRRTDEVLAAVRRGADAPPLSSDDERRPSAESKDAPLIALGEALVRSRAQEAGLAYELVASRADLAAIIVGARRRDGEAEARTLRGWRRDLVGTELLDLLAGRRALDVGPDGRLRVQSRQGA